MSWLDIAESGIPGLLLVRPRLLRDDRGWFTRTYCADVYESMGQDLRLIQENQSRSRRGVIRGLHVRSDLSEEKLVRVVSGSIFDVVVDLRPKSPTFLSALTYQLDAEDPFHLRVPPGCAHGFQVLSPWAEVLYGVSAAYDPAKDVTLRWNDPEFSIPWPLGDPVLSARDRQAPSLKEIRPELAAWFGAYRPPPATRPRKSV